MKKITLIICLLVLFAQVNAQKVNNKIERAKHKKELITKLNLTQEQQSEAKVLNENFKQKLRELKANDNLTLGEYKQKAKALKEERKNLFEAMLTTSQKEQLLNNKIHLKEERKATAKAHFNKLKKELQLTKEQQAKLKEKRNEIKQQIATVKNNTALTQDQKRGELKNLRISQKSYFKSILTKEQLLKFEQHKIIR